MGYKHIQKGLQIMTWFKSLNNVDKSIVLTVIDKELVKLIVKLY